MRLITLSLSLSLSVFSCIDSLVVHASLYLTIYKASSAARLVSATEGGIEVHESQHMAPAPMC